MMSRGQTVMKSSLMETVLLHVHNYCSRDIIIRSGVARVKANPENRYNSALYGTIQIVQIYQAIFLSSVLSYVRRDESSLQQRCILCVQQEVCFCAPQALENDSLNTGLIKFRLPTALPNPPCLFCCWFHDCRSPMIHKTTDFTASHFAPGCASLAAE